jgi:hypothetical protein
MDGTIHFSTKLMLVRILGKTLPSRFLPAGYPSHRPDSNSLALIFPFQKESKEAMRRPAATNRQPREIGRLKKMVKLPLERIKDWRKACSKMGLRTKANTRGAGSYSNLRIRYPKPPKKTIRATSTTLLLTA